MKPRLRAEGGRRIRAPGPRFLLWQWPLLLAMLASILVGHARDPGAASAASHGATAAASRLRRRGGPIRPAPRRASSDVPAPLREGCMIGEAGTESGPCLYGDPRGGRALVLFGDSHVLQYFPALQVIARRNGWRLYVLTKRECTPAEATVLSKEGGAYSQCDAWRQATLKRIEGLGSRAAVVLSGEAKTTALGSGGEELSGGASAAALEAGYVRTLKRIRASGLGAVVIRDDPEAPTDVASCVAEHLQDPSSCDFELPRSRDREFDARAARRVAGTKLVDLDPTICPRGTCQAVIGRVLVYRDEAHLTATFARSLSRMLEPVLKGA